MPECTHMDQIRPVKPHTKGCEECLKMGDTWVHLRLCLECGHVGCCDSSKNKHATKHFHLTKHPIMKSIEPGAQTGAGVTLISGAVLRAIGQVRLLIFRRCNSPSRSTSFASAATSSSDPANQQSCHPAPSSGPKIGIAA